MKPCLYCHSTEHESGDHRSGISTRQELTLESGYIRSHNVNADGRHYDMIWGCESTNGNSQGDNHDSSSDREQEGH